MMKLYKLLNNPLLYIAVIIAFSCALIEVDMTNTAYAEELEPGDPANLSEADLEILKLGQNCITEVTATLNNFIKQGQLTKNQLFDTFYIPIPDTYPTKYHTQYDKLTDRYLTPILDSYLESDKRLLYVVAADKNGYVPSHNSRYCKSLTNNKEYNVKNNRTKRLFNDRTGIKAARNTKKYLLQSYKRDTGEMIYDLSLPIFIENQHWGALRIAYIK